MYRFGFVILHYEAYQMTVCCVDTLHEVLPDAMIVVIDNASPNHSGVLLETRYAKKTNIHVIINDKNVGFARGNNIGYRYLVSQGCDFLVEINNDVIINDPDFCHKIIDYYKSNSFALLGPDIISIAKNKSQNPSRIFPLSATEMNKLDIKHKLRKYFCSLFYLKQLILGPNDDSNENINRNEIMNNVILHGSCIVFSPEFIKVRDHAFCEDTFLFYEEDILWEECHKLGLEIVYYPSVCVYHFEDVSTNQTKRINYSKIKFKAEKEWESFKILKKIRANKYEYWSNNSNI